MCEKQIYRFDHFTIRFASQIRSIHSERVNELTDLIRARCDVRLVTDLCLTMR